MISDLRTPSFPEGFVSLRFYCIYIYRNTFQDLKFQGVKFTVPKCRHSYLAIADYVFQLFLFMHMRACVSM